MNQRRFGIFQAESNIASHTKIRILIDGAGNQSWYRGVSLLIWTEDMRERCCKRGSRLNGGEMDFANIVTTSRLAYPRRYFGNHNIPIIETEYSLALVGSHASTDPDHVLIEASTHKFEIAEDKRFIWIESNGNDFLGVFFGKSNHIVNSQVGFEEEFLIIRQHDNQRNIKDIL